MKYLIVLLVILATEFVATRNRAKARALAMTLVVVHASPVIWSMGLLAFALPRSLA